ncbi:PREDICTED: protodermal factor 1-like [Ipomoea nil]|uniref:protodermal factor 1-like n=1 Tax=Ipomoea nil TaxID=35883 RepID=UPI000900F282|nr:PREDICTED: protodermal factor 1-like [Ipomoea nil]
MRRWSSSLNIKVATMEFSFFTLATMVALLSQTLVVPVMSVSSSPFHYQKTHNSHHPNTRTPTTPSINCDSPPHGGGGGGGSHHSDPTPVSPPSGHHGGGGGGGGGYYHSPPTYTPTPTTPTTPIATPPVDPGTPTTPILPTPNYSPPSGTPPYYTPPSGTPPYYTPPSGTPPHYTPPSGTPPFPFDPNTPPASGTPPTGFDPNSPPFPCTFWKAHPTLIWGMVGWNGNTIRSMFGMNNNNIPGFSGSVNLLEALSNTRTDGYGALYREGTAAMLNSMMTKNFPYTTQQVRDSFGRAALSSNQAAAAQARLFKLANEGHRPKA